MNKFVTFGAAFALLSIFGSTVSAQLPSAPSASQEHWLISFR